MLQAVSKPGQARLPNSNSGILCCEIGIESRFCYGQIHKRGNQVRKLILGCGYLGLRVAARWVSAGDTVFAVTRSAERACDLRAAGVLPIVADIVAPDTLRSLPDVDMLLVAVGYDRRSGLPIGQVYVDGLRNVLERVPSGIQRLLYVSSTGVYGQSDDAWVDEQSVCAPSREGGRACRHAELLLQSHPLSQRVVILRMAGIYGPGRIPRQKELQAGLPIAAASEGYLNLIHVEDAVTAVIAYFLSDDTLALFQLAGMALATFCVGLATGRSRQAPAA